MSASSRSSSSSSISEPIPSPKPQRARAEHGDVNGKTPTSELSDECIIELLREALRQGEVYDVAAARLDPAIQRLRDRLPE